MKKTSVSNVSSGTGLCKEDSEALGQAAWTQRGGEGAVLSPVSLSLNLFHSITRSVFAPCFGLFYQNLTKFKISSVLITCCMVGIGDLILNRPTWSPSSQNKLSNSRKNFWRHLMMKRRDQDWIKLFPKTIVLTSGHKWMLSLWDSVWKTSSPTLQGLHDGRNRQRSFSCWGWGTHESSLVYNLLHPGDSKPAPPSSPAKVFTWHYDRDYLWLALLPEGIRVSMSWEFVSVKRKWN